MATVYGMSSLNIATTAAPDGRVGCLFEHDPVYTRGVQVIVEIDNQESALKLVDVDLFYNNINGAPLGTRAWVV
jgi:hypothetical protein